MPAIFRLSGASKRDPVIEEWLSRSDPLTALARIGFKKIRACGQDVLELMHDGHPVASIEDIPFAYVDVFKSHTNIGFFFGAQLNDPTRLLEGSGKSMRHVKLKTEAQLNASPLQNLIHAAYLDVKLRLRTQ